MATLQSLNFQALMVHIIGQKKIITKVNISFLEIIAERDKVAEIHLAKNNEIVEGKIIAFWTKKKCKTNKCQDLVKFIKSNNGR
jgi:hypothetical protein